MANVRYHNFLKLIERSVNGKLPFGLAISPNGYPCGFHFKTLEVQEERAFVQSNPATVVVEAVPLALNASQLENDKIGLSMRSTNRLGKYTFSIRTTYAAGRLLKWTAPDAQAPKFMAAAMVNMFGLDNTLADRALDRDKTTNAFARLQAYVGLCQREGNLCGADYRAVYSGVNSGAVRFAVSATPADGPIYAVDVELPAWEAPQVVGLGMYDKNFRPLARPATKDVSNFLGYKTLPEPVGKFMRAIGAQVHPWAALEPTLR